MLEEVLRFINNRFEHGSVEGSFAVEGGGLPIESALDGQYFWVEGSALNDGLHQYPATDMSDEQFDGTVWLLAVPRAVVDIADEAEQWCAANAEVVDSPYQSESFGGYSYSRAGSDGGARTPYAAWQSHFGARLRPYRKLYREWR